MITKTQVEIMKIFVSKITEKFSIKKISELLKKPYPLIHRSVIDLMEQGILIRDEHELVFLNYKENIPIISYVESLRAKDFLRNRTLDLFTKDFLDRVNLDFFIFLVFGSSLESKEPRDIDILLIIPESDKIDEIEKIALNVVSNFSKKFDINVISSESAYEMLNKRDKINVLNETLNKHIILFGADNYYRILKNAR